MLKMQLRARTRKFLLILVDILCLFSVALVYLGVSRWFDRSLQYQTGRFFLNALILLACVLSNVEVYVGCRVGLNNRCYAQPLLSIIIDIDDKASSLKKIESILETRNIDILYTEMEVHKDHQLTYRFRVNLPEGLNIAETATQIYRATNAKSIDI